jgi:urease accessory protein UreH
MDLRAQSPELTETWGLSNLPVVSTLYFVHTEETLHESLLDDVREASLECDEFAGTHFDGLSIYRYLGSSTEKARNLTETVWSMYRNRIGRSHGHRPRIWQT